MKYKKLTLVFLVILFLFFFTLDTKALSVEHNNLFYELTFPFEESDYDIFVRRGVDHDNYIRVFAFPKGSVKATYNSDANTIYFYSHGGDVDYIDLSAKNTVDIISTWPYIYNKTIDYDSNQNYAEMGLRFKCK